MSVARAGCRGGVLSDGRFSVLDGEDSNCDPLLACEALLVGDDEHWEMFATDARGTVPICMHGCDQER
jgi:hypothetical protein